MKRGLIILIILVVVLAGCDALRRGDDSGSDVGTTFVGGTQGLDAIFVEGQPPERILDNSEEAFSIVLFVKNLGEYTIPSGKMIATLEGISQEAFSLNSLTVKSQDFLEKRTKTEDILLEGGTLDLDFGEAIYTPDLPGDLDMELKANLCYEYETGAVSSVCLKKNVLRRDLEGVCIIDPNEILDLENSGAPVQITNLRESPSGSNKVNVFFDIDNQGVGEVYEPGTFTDVCEKINLKEDIVRISVDTTSSKINVKCSTLGDSNKGIVKLINGKKTVRCSIDTANLQDTAFIEPLIIKAEYMYREAIYTSLTVTNPGF